MKDIEERIGFWSEADICRTEGESMPHPFMARLEIFESKDVLEIGPGWGRQFKQLSLLASTYCVADICQKVLNRKVYQNVDKFLIRNYQQNFNKKFNVITFWYVLHHLLTTELDDFFLFLDRHLNPDGYLFFNSVSNRPKAYIDSSENSNGDGLMTTAHDIKKLLEIFNKNNFKVLYQEDMADNCYVFLIQKTGGSI